MSVVLNPEFHSPSPSPRRFALVAGEASGDLLGAGLITALRERYPDAIFAGVGGPRMQAAGFEAWHAADELAVMGLAEVVRHLPRLLALRRDVRTAHARVSSGCLHRHRCARLQLRARTQAEVGRHPHGALRQPVDLGLAREARAHDRAQRRSRALSFSVRARDLRQARRQRDVRRPPARRRVRARSRAGARARSARTAGRRAGARACCRAAGSAKSVVSPRISSARRSCCASDCRICR